MTGGGSRRKHGRWSDEEKIRAYQDWKNAKSKGDRFENWAQVRQYSIRKVPYLLSLKICWIDCGRYSGTEAVSQLLSAIYPK